MQNRLREPTRAPLDGSLTATACGPRATRWRCPSSSSARPRRRRKPGLPVAHREDPQLNNSANAGHVLDLMRGEEHPGLTPQPDSIYAQ